MSGWVTPVLNTIFEDILAVYRALRPNARSAPFSDLWTNAKTWAHIVRWLHEHQDTALARFFWTTCTGEWLNKCLYFVGAPDGDGGYGLIKAHTSAADDGCKVTCVSGTPSVQYEELVDPIDGARYQLNEPSPYNFPGTGYHNCDVISVDTGLAVNLEVGHALEFVSPPAGIQKACEIVAKMSGGRDLETDQEGQARLIAYAQRPSLSGNWPHWVRWVEEYLPGQLDAWVWKGRNNGPYGWGTVDVTATWRNATGADRQLSDSGIAAGALAYLEETVPELSMKQLRLLGLTLVKKTIIIHYTLVDGATQSVQVDWNAHDEQKDVSADTEGSKLIEVATDWSTGLLDSGMRVLIAGKEAEIALEPGNAGLPTPGSMKQFTVKTWPWDVDLTTDGPGGGAFAICAGGGIAMDIYNAASAYLNGIDGDIPDGRGTLPKLGPARGPYAAPQPGRDDTIRIHCLKSAVVLAADGNVTDVSTVTIGGSATDVAPSYDVTASVEMLIADEIELYQDPVT